MNEELIIQYYENNFQYNKNKLFDLAERLPEKRNVINEIRKYICDAYDLVKLDDGKKIFDLLRSVFEQIFQDLYLKIRKDNYLPLPVNLDEWLKNKITKEYFDHKELVQKDYFYAYLYSFISAYKTLYNKGSHISLPYTPTDVFYHIIRAGELSVQFLEKEYLLNSADPNNFKIINDQLKNLYGKFFQFANEDNFDDLLFSSSAIFNETINDKNKKNDFVRSVADKYMNYILINRGFHGKYSDVEEVCKRKNISFDDYISLIFEYLGVNDTFNLLDQIKKSVSPVSDNPSDHRTIISFIYSRYLDPTSPRIPVNNIFSDDSGEFKLAEFDLASLNSLPCLNDHDLIIFYLDSFQTFSKIEVNDIKNIMLSINQIDRLLFVLCIDNVPDEEIDERLHSVRNSTKKIFNSDNIIPVKSNNLKLFARQILIKLFRLYISNFDGELLLKKFIIEKIKDFKKIRNDIIDKHMTNIDDLKEKISKIIALY